MAESHQDRRDRDQAELVELRNRLREDVEGLAVDLLGEPSSRSVMTATAKIAKAVIRLPVW